MNYGKMDNGGLSVNQGVQIGRNVKGLEKTESMHKTVVKKMGIKEYEHKDIYRVRGDMAQNR
jgi:hypothetical protein